MTDVLHVTNIMIKRILPNTTCVIYFWKAHAKSSLMDMIKTSHVTCVTCHKSHMLNVTNIKINRILPNCPCVIYCWKSHAKFSAMVMIKTSHVTYVTCRKYQFAKKLTKDPVCYIFLESLCKIQFNDHDKNITCHICYMSHVTHVTCHKYKVEKNFTKYSMCYKFLECSCKIQWLKFMMKMLHMTCEIARQLKIRNNKLKFYSAQLRFS